MSCNLLIWHVSRLSNPGIEPRLLIWPDLKIQRPSSSGLWDTTTKQEMEALLDRTWWSAAGISPWDPPKGDQIISASSQQPNQPASSNSSKEKALSIRVSPCNTS